MSPNPLDAGTVVIDGMGASKTVSGTLTSSTNVHVDLRIRTSSCSGGGGVFELSPNTNINLNGGAMVTVDLTYTPSARGTRTCTVDIFDNGTTTSLGTFTIRGTGNTQQTMDTSAAALDFSSVRWNNAPLIHTVNRNITVQNNGDQTLTVSSISLGGANPGDWSVTSGGTNGPWMIAGNGGTKTWTLTFDPTTGGGRSATFSINGDAPGNPTDSVTLGGTGLNAVIGVVTPVNFGTVNSGSSSSMDVTINNDAMTNVGNLGVYSATISPSTSWFTFSGCGGGTSCTFFPSLFIPTSTVVGVKCTPPAAAAGGSMQTATVTFSSDTDSGTANVATLNCTAGKSELASNMNVVSFTPQLVTSTTMPNMVTITNNGNVPTTFFLAKTGLNQDQFSITTPTGCGLTGILNQCTIAASGGTATFTVTFTPGVEGDISAGVTITPPAPAVAVPITLTGRGIDRHVEMIDAVQALDTYRNPGTNADKVTIAIKNIGEYPLEIQKIELDGQSNWELETEFSGSIMVPGLAQHDLVVLFKPLVVGKAPDGVLAVTTDDRMRPLVRTVLSGNGKDRNITWGENAVEFGNRGAGVPIHLSAIRDSAAWPVATNKEMGGQFRITRLSSSMPDVFQLVTLDGKVIDDRDGGDTLTFNYEDSYQFDVIFTPSDVRDYHATLDIYLDDESKNNSATRSIAVHGNAVYVDAHGGGGFGGCSSGHGAGGGLILVVGALLRRKRRRA